MKEGSGDDPFADDEPQESDTEGSGRDVPWIFTRENVKADRSMVQFYLRDETKDREEEFVDELEDRLGTDVSKTDAREAGYLAAMKNPEIVEDELREWGFDLKG